MQRALYESEDFNRNQQEVLAYLRRQLADRQGGRPLDENLATRDAVKVRDPAITLPSQRSGASSCALLRLVLAFGASGRDGHPVSATPLQNQAEVLRLRQVLEEAESKAEALQATTAQLTEALQQAEERSSELEAKVRQLRPYPSLRHGPEEDSTASLTLCVPPLLLLRKRRRETGWRTLCASG